MEKPAEKSEEFLNLMVDWQALETEEIEHANERILKEKNPFTKTLLHILRFEAEKHCAVQQMIIDSVEKEAVKLSPDELAEFSDIINRRLEASEKILSRALAVSAKSELIIPHYLLSYLISEARTENELLKKLDDELKTAQIPTSATSKIFG